MPPTFLYMLALFIYTGLASLALAICLLLILFPQTRRTAWRSAISVLATYLGIFTLHLLILPILLVGFLFTMGVIFLLEKVSEPMFYIFGIMAVLIGFLLMLTASIYGAFLGWKVAWEITGGRRLSEIFIICKSDFTKRISFLKRKLSIRVAE